MPDSHLLSLLQGFTKFLKQHAKVPYTLPKKGEAGDEGESEAKKDEKDEL